MQYENLLLTTETFHQHILTCTRNKIFFSFFLYAKNTHKRKCPCSPFSETATENLVDDGSEAN